MAVKEMTTSDWQETRVVLRALGAQIGLRPGDKVGLALLVVAVAKVAGPDAAEALRSAGVRDVPAFLTALPDVSPVGLDCLPELKADARLAKFLRGELAGFMAGKVDAGEALRVLLSPECLDRDVRRVLADPTALSSKGNGDELHSTRELVRALAGYYQPRFHAGYRQFVVDASSGYSEFLQGGKAKGSTKLADELRDGERQATRAVFASRLYDRSPLGACRRNYGELEAHILGAAILGEMTLVAQGPLSVNALAWTIDPCRYHRLAGLVLEKVAYLQDKGLLVVQPDQDVRLHSHVLPASPTMNDWLAFLREADPITDEEVKDTLDRMY